MIKKFYTKISSLILLILIQVTSVYAQRAYMEDNKVYKKAKIFQNARFTIMAKNLVLSNDSIRYLDESNTPKIMALSTNNIRAISVNHGLQVLPFAAGGGLFGLLVSLEARISVKNNSPVDFSRTNWSSVAFDYTIGGIVIGALMGSCTPRWKTLFIRNNKTGCLLKVSPNISRNYCCLGIKISL